MTTPALALKTIFKYVQSYGTELVKSEDASGRVLAQAIYADRDTPPFNRSTMDGIAIRFTDFQAGKRKYTVLAVQAAGNAPLKEIPAGNCVQIMTGAAVPEMTDTVIPIEDIKIYKGTAIIASDNVTKGQFIHSKGIDKLAGDILVASGKIVNAASLPIAATVGLTTINVSKPPRIAIVSTGDELVSTETTPSDYQIRRSNNYAIRAALEQYSVPAEMFHLPDEPAAMLQILKDCAAAFDVIIISGGVSKGEFDFVPKILTKLDFETHFHGVKQKPGKPLLFGSHPDGTIVFALPGNPVSTFLCFYKYIRPWLQACLGAVSEAEKYAVLGHDVHFTLTLDYFLQVSLHTNTDGLLIATPIANNGSGDFVSLVDADAFIELPAQKDTFHKGEAYPIVSLSRIL